MYELSDQINLLRTFIGNDRSIKSISINEINNSLYSVSLENCLKLYDLDYE